jgi:hypothetical protein
VSGGSGADDNIARNAEQVQPLEGYALARNAAVFIEGQPQLAG